MKTKLFFIISLLCLGLVGVLQAQQSLVAWNFNLAAQKGAINANTKASGVQLAILSRGPGLTYNNSSTLSYVSLFNTADKSEADALRNNSYYQIEIKPSLNKKISLIEIKARLRTSGAESVKAYRWYYSTDGVKYQPVDKPATYIGHTHGQGENQPPISLVGVAALANVEAAYLRLYAWGTDNSEVLLNRAFGFGKGQATESGRSVLELSGTVN